MLLSIVIPTYRRLDALRLCLNQLAPSVQDVSLDKFEIVVTDDAPDNVTKEALQKEYPWVRHNPGPQKGPACNRNSGARACRGEWLIFLDDDCIPQPYFLSAYLEAIKQNPEYSVFEGSTIADRPKNRLDEEAPINARGGFLWSCNFLIKRSTFVQNGGFCELYPYACMEDVDFREQLQKNHIKFLFIARAQVIHPWRTLSLDEKYLKILLISHEIFFQRYPQLRPSFYITVRTVIREWMVGIFIDGRKLKFRGFSRYLNRLLTLSRFHFTNWLRLKISDAKKQVN